MKYILVITLTFLVGCSSTYDNTLVKDISVKLSQSKSVNITTPVNGVYGETVYKGSGDMTAKALKSSFIKYSDKVSIDSNGDYEVKPEILHWEDRATEWSGKRDVIKVLISVYENNNLISKYIIFGRSKWFTFGGDHPEDLLQSLVDKHVQSLYK